MFSELPLACVLIVVLTVPGWAILSVNQEWRRWDTLQRWCLAIGISIAFYPVLFYATRLLLPSFSLGPYKLVPLLLAGVALIVWQMHGAWREQFAFDSLEWIALAVMGMTLFTRFWIIRDQPYPAWTDSLHHAILTQLTAEWGRLPATMEPYFPVSLGEYHLGLYALSGTVEMLARVPAHTALLWTAQALNGLCGLGVYLVLDRLSGRTGAIVGAAVVGLFSLQPAWYVNWGRFTQVASQAILLIAWYVTWQAVVAWRKGGSDNNGTIAWQTGVAALLTASVFLLHFRVAAFYLPLLALSLGWELVKARREGGTTRIAVGMLVTGACAMMLVSPVLLEALGVYAANSIRFAANLSAEELVQARRVEFITDWASIPVLVGQPWLVVSAVVAAIVGILHRDKLVSAVVFWCAMLFAIGELYLLDIPLLAFTNLSGVLIMFYLPIGLAIGATMERLLDRIGPDTRTQAVKLVVGVALVAGFYASHIRAASIEPYRYLVTPADLAAMEWIEHSTPLDACFAVNTVFWMPGFPHGTDGGYWIPYLAHRRTTAGSMMFRLGKQDYVNQITSMSRAVARLEVESNPVEELNAMGVGYVYIGSKGNFASPGLSADRLSHVEGANLVYQQNGVAIFQIGQ